MTDYTTQGRVVLRNNHSYLSAARPEMAEQMAETFNEIAAYERGTLGQNPAQAWLLSYDLERAIRVALADPGKRTDQRADEPVLSWQARSVLHLLRGLA